MKKKLPYLQQFTFAFLLLILAASCSGINRAADIFVKPTAKEIYLRDLQSPQLQELWEEQAELALQDSVLISLPYTEKGKFLPKTFPVYSYELALNAGEKLLVEVETDSLETLVFLDLYKQKIDSLVTYEHLLSAEHQSSSLEEEISSPGIYRIVVQPEIEAHTPFHLRIQALPIYEFPVSSEGNSAIQSFWGAERDGGRRSHEGIDIFAPKGTPVVATTEARVSRTGNRGLGGKQVWLRDSERGLSLYYAHLDSIIATPGMRVSPGDTLGLVGNTGNSRTTPPHLHFGIYKGFSGAVNPLPYVYQKEIIEPAEVPSEILTDKVFITTGTANLRRGPSTKYPVLSQIQARDTLRVMGKAEAWYHIRNRNKSSFIHESLVKSL